jgi:hypothetical protein
MITKMQRPSIAVVVAFCMLFLFPGAARASQIRGRVQHIYPNGVGPVVGVPVTVYNERIGRSIAVNTDASGMYYLAVPAGQYYLEVWVNPSGPPVVFGPFNVAEPATDVPPVNV